MIQDYPDRDLFKKQMRESLQREVKNSRAFKIPKHEKVYTIGEQDEMVYFIESGEVKLLMLSNGPPGNCDRNGRHAIEEGSVCKVP